MNVLLINPSSPNIAKISTDFDLEIGNIGRFPPIGLISLAAYVREHSHHKIDVLDCEAEGTDDKTLIEHIGDRKIGVVGITAFTYTFYDVLQIARKIKENFPDAVVVIGGPHTMLFAQETLTHREFDYIVIGEGEEPFLFLLDKIEKGEQPGKVAGLGFRETDGYFVGAPAWVENLDALPFPAYDLINADKYNSTFGYGGKTITLCSSRGCPYHCTYCQVLTKKYRAHSISNIVDYMKLFYAQGYRNFYFFDDLFNITAKRVIEFSQMIRRENMDITWIFRGRIDAITEEVCREAAGAGCVQILFGIEDYTNEGLKKIRKNITIEQAKAAVKCARKFKIKTSTNWILGLPTHKSAQDFKHLVGGIRVIHNSPTGANLQAV